MRNIFKIWLLILLIFALQACVEKDRLEKQVIHQAELLMQEQPDSALHLLQTLQRHSLTGETLARYALIHSIAQDKSGLDVTSDSLLRIAYDYYYRHPEDSLYARSQYYMGKYYSLVDSTKQAEDCLRTAVRYAGERKEYYTQYLALDRLSHTVRYADAPRALEYSKQALDVYSQKCSPHAMNQVFLLKDIGKVYLLCNSMEDSALYYMEMALEKATLLNDSSVMGGILQDKSLVYSKLKDYQQALSLAKDAWRMSPSKSINLASRLASCYADADSAHQARELYATILRVGENERKYIAYKNLSLLAAKEHDLSLFQLYSDSAYECMEAIYKQSLKTKAAYYNDIIQLEEEKLQKERESARKRLINLCILVLFVVALVIASSVYIHIRYKTKRKLESERERHLLQEEFTREQHERELKHKNIQISMMRSLIMERCHFRQSIEEQKKSGKHITLTPEDWTEIAGFLNAMSDDFLSRLKEAYPMLREKDYQFCMLVRLKFPNKDLANMCGISEPSLKQKLVDYKERLQVPAGGMSFKQFISKF
ncbi:MAG: hypothetical protein IKP44_07180 [Bacteroidaceae bacterium]|nr:hypothetical protein [Bacteroidaceae bacterium]